MRRRCSAGQRPDLWFRQFSQGLAEGQRRRLMMKSRTMSAADFDRSRGFYSCATQLGTVQRQRAWPRRPALFRPGGCECEKRPRKRPHGGRTPTGSGNLGTRGANVGNGSTPAVRAAAAQARNRLETRHRTANSRTKNISSVRQSLRDVSPSRR